MKTDCMNAAPVLTDEELRERYSEENIERLFPTRGKDKGAI